MSLFRSGYTTGTCAAAAAKAAMLLLGQGQQVEQVSLQLPGGETVGIAIAWTRLAEDCAEAAVVKDAGDDPDVTHRSSVIARVGWTQTSGEIRFVAGEGVGTVTKPGLQIPPGEPAINPVPRQMIRQAVSEVHRLQERGVSVTISIPGGRELAAKTYSSRLGIEGGLSILGTSGIVRPFSHESIRETVRTSLSVALACGHLRLVLVPGNIGYRAACQRLSLPPEQVVEVANEWGFALDLVGQSKVEAVLVVGHPGKLAKLAEGVWQTHSSQSQSAAPFVRQFVQQVLGREDIPESQTVDGVFTSLNEMDRRQVADALAGVIATAVCTRLSRHCQNGVLLTSMSGEIWGSAGDVPRWA